MTETSNMIQVIVNNIVRKIDGDTVNMRGLADAVDDATYGVEDDIIDAFKEDVYEEVAERLGINLGL